MSEPKPLSKAEIEELVQEDASFIVPELSPILIGKTAIVTGCSSGLGAATMLTFLRGGANVIGCYYSPADEKIYQTNAIDSVLSLAENYLGKFMVHNLDIADENTPKQLVESAMDHYKNLTTLCNFAGIAQFLDFENMDRETYNRTLAVNLHGPVFLAKEAVKEMKRNPIVHSSRGSIINMSSVAGGIIGENGVLPYGITKGAMHAFTLELAVELGPYKIRANSLAPGSITTPINYRDLGDKKRKEGIEYRTPLERWGYAQEVANVALFLASDLSSFVNATLIPVDGGLVSTFRL